MKENIETMLAMISPEMQPQILRAMARRMREAEVEEILESITERERYYNYLTQDEARLAADAFVNFDGSQGAKWSDPSIVFQKADDLGIQKEKEGSYNKWAFFLAVNMIYSDYGGVLRQYAEGDRFVKMCMTLAVASLCDKDREDGRTIRWYLNID